MSSAVASPSWDWSWLHRKKAVRATLNEIGQQHSLVILVSQGHTGPMFRTSVRIPRL